MKNAVWKYPLIEATNKIEMPKDAQILTIHEQYGNGCLWAMVNPDNENEARTFQVVGTGWEFPDGMAYLGTFHLTSMGLVFHVFEENVKS